MGESRTEWPGGFMPGDPVRPVDGSNMPAGDYVVCKRLDHPIDKTADFPLVLVGLVPVTMDGDWRADPPDIRAPPVWLERIEDKKAESRTQWRCVSCGRPGSAAPWSLHGRSPRCHDCGEALLRRDEGRMVGYCWCGGGAAWSALTADYVCEKNHEHTLGGDTTGPAWDHVRQPGADRRDAIFREMFRP